MPTTEYQKLVTEYGEVKARKAVEWFVENHTPDFRDGVWQYQFCRDNESLWF